MDGIVTVWDIVGVQNEDPVHSEEVIHGKESVNVTHNGLWWK